MPYPSIDCHDEYRTYRSKIRNNDEENLSLSNSDENLSRNINSSIEINNDFESAIRNLRPLAAIQQKQVDRLLTKSNSKDFTRNNHDG